MKYLLLLVSILIWGGSFTYAQKVITLGASEDPSAYETLPSFDKISKNRIRLLPIGIGRFNDDKFSTLKSYIELYRFKTEKIAEDYIWPSYDEHELIDGLVNEIVEKEKVVSKLHNLVKTSAKTDIVIISILSHGAYKDGEYYLICTDSKTDNYEKTAISGHFLREIIKAIADKGAIVLLFLDTCHAGALYNNVENLTPKDNGIIAFYASSSEKESAKEIMLESFFTKSFVNTLGNQNEDAFINGFVTLGSIDNQIRSSVRNQKRNWEQHPVLKFFPNSLNIGYPIIKKATTTGPEEKEISLYFGLSSGQPLASAFIGLTLFKYGKLEAGVSYCLCKESKDVYLYNPSGVIECGYNYKPSSFRPFLRAGFEIPFNDYFSLSILAGLSYATFTGEPVTGYETSTSKGKKAAALMLSPNIRFLLSPIRKLKKLQIHVNGGYELGLGDPNYNVLLKSDNFKKIAEGLVVQGGITYNF